MTKSMKAVRIHKYGGPEVLVYEDAPHPKPKADELLIRVHASSVNPADWTLVSLDKPDRQYPWIPGYDVSGVVVETGSHVSDFDAGDAVFGQLYPTPAGAYAEYAVVPPSQMARKPASLDYLEAAAMPTVGLTAWQALFGAGQLSAGQTVLIHAAAGGVGHIAVQLAKWKDARVIGIASGRNAPFLDELGVDELVDYTTTRFEDVIRKVDVVLEMFGGDTVERSLGVLKKGGIFVSIKRAHPPEVAAQHEIRSRYILAQTNTAGLQYLATLADEGHLKPHISTVLPLCEARRAFELSQKGHTRGKIVLRVVE